VIILALAFHLFLLANLQFTVWPEMLSYPYLFSNGFSLYGGMAYPYSPLLTAILAGWLSVFGFSVFALKIFTWLGIAATDIFVLLSLRELFDKAKAYFLLALFILAQSVFDGNMMWFDNFLILPLSAAFYFFLKRKFYLLGAALAIATFTKQTAFIYPLVFAGYLFYRKDFAALKKVTAPIVFFWVIFLLYLLLAGQLQWFLNWNYIYPLTFWTGFPGYTDLAPTKQELFLLVLIASSAILVIRKKVITAALVFAALVATYPRFSFFHLQPAIVFLPFAIGYAGKKFAVPVAFLLLVIAMPIFARNWGEQDRFTGRETAEIIGSFDEERVYLLGVHSANYVFSRTLPPKPWVDNFGWYMEIPGIQQEVIQGIEREKIDTILIRVPREGNWFDIGVYLPDKVVEHVRRNFDNKGEIVEGIELWQREK